MTIPGADPKYPPYGRGTGQSPAAVGPSALAHQPIPTIDARTDPAYTRRYRRANTQELGLEMAANHEPMASHTETPTAAIQAEPIASHDPMSNKP